MKHLLLLFTLFSILVSCEKDELIPVEKNDTPDEKELSLEQQMNEFIEEKMKDIYLWADSVKDRDIDTDQDPSTFLKAMMSKNDKWSSLEITEGATKANIDGEKITFGYEMKFYDFGSNGIITGVIQYVYHGTPAFDAGLKRGDVIFKNNGEFLSMSNYLKVIYDPNVSLNKCFYSDDSLIYSEKNYVLSARKAVLKPILLDTILEVGDKKVGYFVYSQFIDNGTNSLSDLSEAIGKMKTESIDEFILDLRYNTGGRVSAAVRLASLLAPRNAVENESILIYKQWNEKYQQLYQSTSGATEDFFDPSALADNLDLSNIYILIGAWTASASELVISGLRPYTSNIVLIGEKTYGKYVGASQILPKNELQKWTLWPITFSYTNVRGDDVKGGIDPSITVKEYSDYLLPFGSLDDIVLAKAIELISGELPAVASLQTRSPRAADSWKLLESGNKYLLID